MKRCPRCGQTKALSDFHRATRRSDGVQSVCKCCRAVIDRALYLRRSPEAKAHRTTWDRGRMAWLRALKARPCTDCGRTFPPAAMQWDHLPGTEKLGAIGSGLRFLGRAKVLEEIAKCELVCTVCHAIRTHERRIRARAMRGISDPEAAYRIRADVLASAA